MKTIIVPTDFSPDASKAYVMAGHIASQSDTEIVLLHILSAHLDFINDMAFGAYGSNNIFEKDPQTEVEDATKKLDDLVNSAVFKGAKVTYFISQSHRANPLKEVLDFLNKKEHSVVIMGTSGDDFGGDTNAEFIVRKSTIPVLTVRKEVKEVRIQKILCPTDFKTVNKKFIKRLETMAEVLNASVEYVYINTPKQFKDTDFIDKEWRQFKQKFKVSSDNFTVFNDHDVVLGIEKMISRLEVDMLALPTHGRTGLEHFFNGSYTEDIINEVSIPVYSYNMHNDYRPIVYGYAGANRGF